MLRAADKAIVFLYPNTQNTQGIDLLLKALAGKVAVQLVFSPIPFGEAGQQKVKEHWASLQQVHKNGLINPDESKLTDTNQNDTLPDEEELEEDSDSQSALAEPIAIQYLTELALASSFPVLALVSHYMNIANVIDEETTTSSLEEVLSHASERWKIIESLQFPEVDAADPSQNLRDLFQRTNDFEKFLDDATCLIRGRKGLFYLVQASDAQRLTNVRFKIFLREDIWNRLSFDNKSHFNGRDIILQWTPGDFLRLALRQALQSPDFAELDCCVARRLAPSMAKNCPTYPARI